MGGELALLYLGSPSCGAFLLFIFSNIKYSAAQQNGQRPTQCTQRLRDHGISLHMAWLGSAGVPRPTLAARMPASLLLDERGAYTDDPQTSPIAHEGWLNTKGNGSASAAQPDPASFQVLVVPIPFTVTAVQAVSLQLSRAREMRLVFSALWNAMQREKKNFWVGRLLPGHPSPRSIGTALQGFFFATCSAGRLLVCAIFMLAP
jgi:hypothetical protein